MLFFKTQSVPQAALAKDFLSGLKLPAIDSTALVHEAHRPLDVFSTDYSRMFVERLTELSPKSAGAYWPKWLEFCGCDEATALRRAFVMLHADGRGRLAALLHSFFVHSDSALWPEVRRNLRAEAAYVTDPLCISLLSDLAFFPFAEDEPVTRENIAMMLSGCCPEFDCTFDWMRFGSILNSFFELPAEDSDAEVFAGFARRLRLQPDVKCGMYRDIVRVLRKPVPQNPAVRKALGEVFEVLTCRSVCDSAADGRLFYAILCERENHSLLVHALKENDASLAEALGQRLIETLPEEGSCPERVFDYSKTTLDAAELNSIPGPKGGVQKKGSPLTRARRRFGDLPDWTFLSKEVLDLIDRLNIHARDHFRYDARKLWLHMESGSSLDEKYTYAQTAFIKKEAKKDPFFAAIMKWAPGREEDAREIVRLAGRRNPYLAAYAVDVKLAKELFHKTFWCPFEFMRKAVYSNIGSRKWFQAGGCWQIVGNGFIDKRGWSRVITVLCEAIAKKWHAPKTDPERLALELVNPEGPFDSDPEAGALPFMVAVNKRAWPESSFVASEILRVGMPVIMKNVAEGVPWALKAYSCALHAGDESRCAALAQIGTPEWLAADHLALHSDRIRFSSNTIAREYSLSEDIAEAYERNLISREVFVDVVKKLFGWPKTLDPTLSDFLAVDCGTPCDRIRVNCCGVGNALKAIVEKREKRPWSFLKCFENKDSAVARQAVDLIGTDLWQAAGGWNLYGVPKNPNYVRSAIVYMQSLADHAFIAMQRRESDEERKKLIELVADAHGRKILQKEEWGIFLARVYVNFGISTADFRRYVTADVWAKLPKRDPNCKEPVLKKLASLPDFPGRFRK